MGWKSFATGFVIVSVMLAALGCGARSIDEGPLDAPVAMGGQPTNMPRNDPRPGDIVTQPGPGRPGRSPPTECVPGSARTCAAASGCAGIQSCAAAGTWSECRCGATMPPPPPPPPPIAVGGGPTVSDGNACMRLSDDSRLIISWIQLGIGIEFFNPTREPVVLSSLDAAQPPYFLCSPYVYYTFGNSPDDDFPMITVPPGGYVAFPWPAEGNESTDRGGMMILYDDADFFSSASMVDFVCWGDLNEAMADRKDLDGVPWQGPCAPALIQGTIRRLPGTGGEDAASYDTTSSTTRACP